MIGCQSHPRWTDWAWLLSYYKGKLELQHYLYPLKLKILLSSSF